MNLRRRLIRFLVLASLAGGAIAQDVRAVYQTNPPPRDLLMREALDRFRSGRLLESLAENTSGMLRLQQPITLALGECGRANAFYSAQTRVLVMCLELMKEMMDRINREHSKLTRAQSGELFAGAFSFVFFHELGHALIDVQSLPVLGREEDAADQISTFLIFEALREKAHLGVAGGIWFFTRRQLVPGLFSQRHLSGEHSLHPQRAANLACWAFGRAPQTFAWTLQAGQVTRERAVRCSQEYGKLERSVRQLLGPALR